MQHGLSMGKKLMGPRGAGHPGLAASSGGPGDCIFFCIRCLKCGNGNGLVYVIDIIYIYIYIYTHFFFEMGFG